MAEVFSMAGDHVRALELLEDSVDSFHPTAFITEHCPFFAPLRGTPRFAAYAARAERMAASFAGASA